VLTIFVKLHTVVRTGSLLDFFTLSIRVLHTTSPSQKEHSELVSLKRQALERPVFPAIIFAILPEHRSTF
jgi:hypothetical protein